MSLGWEHHEDRSMDDGDDIWMGRGLLYVVYESTAESAVT
jgi:hypothetical protein